MGNAWIPFYFGDYLSDTSHLSLAEHGAYLLLMAHYYRTRRPLPANASVLHRVCRCTTDADKHATDQVVAEFFVLDGDLYHHHRIDQELLKAAGISEVRRAAANARYQKTKSANAPANAVQMDTQPQPQSQPQSQPKSETTKGKVKSVCADAHGRHSHPTIEEVTTYCAFRGKGVDPQQWFDHYSANGWKVGRNAMRDWRAAIRTWEKNGVNNGKRNGNQAPRQAGLLDARDEARTRIMARGSIDGAS